MKELYRISTIWTQNHVYFASRLKTNAVYTVIELMRNHYRKKEIAKVFSDEIIELELLKTQREINKQRS